MKTLRFNWNREKVYLPTDEKGVFNYRLVYVCTIRPNLVVNVWRDGASWRYAVIGFANDLPLEPLILKHGAGPTKNECQNRAEKVLENAQIQPEQKDFGLFSAPRSNANLSDSDVPF